MRHLLTAFALALVLAAPVGAAGVTGQYMEARNCDIYTGPCFANAETFLTGKHAVMGWKVDQGSLDGVKLDGLSIVAVVQASDTLGQEQTGAAKAVLIVDKRASAAQKDALMRMVRKQAGALVKNVVGVETAAIDLERCECKSNSCAVLRAGKARLQTRCLSDKHDKICGNESEFYPPLASHVKARAAMTVENVFTGTGLNATWKDQGRRSAYVGTFELR